MNTPSRRNLFSPLNIALQVGALELGADPEPAWTSTGDGFTPATDAGTAEYKVGSQLAAIGHTDAPSSHTLYEHLMLVDTPATGYAVYPAQAPRLPGASPSDVDVVERGTQYANASAFIANVRGDLGLGSTDSATYARAAVRRFEVDDVSDLANDLSEVSPASLAISKLVGKDAEDNVVIGWVYTETATTVGSKAVKQVHQFIPPQLLLPPNEGLVIKDFDNTSSWDLQDLVNEKVQVGWQYSRCLCWYEEIDSQGELASAGMPSAPATPDGVSDWT
ncbi:MAG: hypothetical protein H6739_15200 [Alphaproteobacteria bacterium]|nr:hypothetical protein [Alphaproteobacteria bacterium]